MEAFEFQTMGKVFQELHKFRHAIVPIHRLTAPKTRKVRNIYPKMLTESGHIWQPCLSTSTTTVDYNQWLTLSSSKVVSIKCANFYLFTVYCIYHFTFTTQGHTLT